MQTPHRTAALRGTNVHGWKEVGTRGPDQTDLRASPPWLDDAARFVLTVRSAAIPGVAALKFSLIGAKRNDVGRNAQPKSLMRRKKLERLASSGSAGCVQGPPQRPRADRDEAQPGGDGKVS